MTTAQKALRQWRNLPADERERLNGAATSVRVLAVELAGDKAPTFLGSDAQGVSRSAVRRDRDVIARELRDAVAVLVAAAGSSSMGNASPRTRKGKLGMRLAAAG